MKWVTDFLVEKWDMLRFLKLDAALYIARSLKDLIKSSALGSFYKREQLPLLNYVAFTSK